MTQEQSTQMNCLISTFFFCNDARAINTDELPDFDLLVGGFPCQDYPEKNNIPKFKVKAA